MRDPDELTEARLADAQRVLVVDDEASILELLQQFFARLGYDCVCFDDGDDALVYMASHHVDLVITDMVMPLGLSGLQLVEAIDERFPRVPVIVMTGYPIIEAVTRCLQAGAADYVQKPFDFARLKTIVRAVLVEKAIESDAMLRNRIISGYRIMRPLKEDAFAPTFLARKADNPDTEYALRIFRFSKQTPRQRRRIQEDFNRGARLAAKIKNPYVLRVVDYGVEAEGEIPYLVTDHFQGDDLRTWYRNNLPPVTTLVSVLRDVARGLAGMHKAGLIHSDMTPESILVSARGELRLNPFTPARIRHADTTVHSVISGTPAYLAPEIYLGLNPTPAVDLFSLGVIAYEMISGQRPFQAASLAEFAEHICQHPHPPLISIAPFVPQRLSDAVDLLLAKDPNDRFPNAASAAVELASAFRPETPDEPDEQPED